MAIGLLRFYKRKINYIYVVNVLCKFLIVLEYLYAINITRHSLYVHLCNNM